MVEASAIEITWGCGMAWPSWSISSNSRDDSNRRVAVTPSSRRREMYGMAATLMPITAQIASAAPRSSAASRPASARRQPRRAPQS